MNVSYEAFDIVFKNIDADGSGTIEKEEMNGFIA